MCTEKARDLCVDVWQLSLDMHLGYLHCNDSWMWTHSLFILCIKGKTWTVGGDRIVIRAASASSWGPEMVKCCLLCIYYFSFFFFNMGLPLPPLTGEFLTSLSLPLSQKLPGRGGRPQIPGEIKSILSFYFSFFLSLYMHIYIRTGSHYTYELV